MTEGYYIYGLFDPRNALDPHNCRYIGQTSTTLDARLNRHVDSARSDSKKHRHVNRWIASLLDAGVRPVIMLFQTVTLETIDQAEREWIANARWLDWDLTNHQPGGKNNMLIPGAKEKVGAAHRGMKRSDETKRKMSLAQMGKSPTPEARAKISASLTGRKGPAKSEETRRKIGDAHRGKTISEEHRQFMSEFGTARFAEPGAREAYSELMSEVMSRPEVRQKISEGQRARMNQKRADALKTTLDSDPFPKAISATSKFIITERYNWICQVCFEPIDPSLTYIDPISGKVDPGYGQVYLAVPPSAGGERIYGNMRLGHGGCAKKEIHRLMLEAGTHPGQYDRNPVKERCAN